MLIPFRYQFILVIGLVHLILVAMGTAYVDFESLPWIGKALDRYGEMSGASENYGFFAPGIEGQLRVWFDLTDGAGNHQERHLERGFNHEADLRVDNIVDQFSAEHDDPIAFQRSLAASLAASMVNQYPGTREVVVHIDEFRPVSMSEYRQGARATWHDLYRADFKPPANSP